MLWLDIQAGSRGLAYARHFSSAGGILITETAQDAQKLAREMSFYDPSLKERILYLPDNETLPFDLQQAPAIIMSQRAAVFASLVNKGKDSNHILVTSASNCMRLSAGVHFWTDHHYSLMVGTNLNSVFHGMSFSQALENMGYEQVAEVKTPGTWATRGTVIDIFPVGLTYKKATQEHLAIRARLDERSEIQAILQLDTLTQESRSAQITRFDLFPNREYDLNKKIVEGFRQMSFDYHENPRDVQSYQLVSAGQDHPELSSWIGLDPNGCITPALIAPSGTVIFDGLVDDAMTNQWRLISERHDDVSHDKSRICPPIEMSWVSPERVHQDLLGRPRARLALSPIPSGMQRLGTLTDAISLLKALLDDNTATLFVMNSDVRIRHIRMMCSMVGKAPKILGSFAEFEGSPVGLAVVQGDLTDGYTDLEKGYRVITETEVFGASIESAFEEEIGEHHRRVILQGLGGIQLDDPIVHALQGVGRFQGFESMELGDSKEDMLKIGYAKDASIFVRVNDLDMISRYNGADPDKAPLSKLNDGSWLKGLQVAQDSALKVAESLIKIRNARQRASGIVLNQPDEKYNAFCETFVYEETRDQKRAIADIISDLTSGKPMDRLICGDVGFGKTEVAMRAAFMMAMQGYQVAFMAPTTILAEQHYQSVCKRFEDTPVKVLLANQNTLSVNDIASIKSGKVSIVIGTHRILQSDIDFAKLGLIIIDEEHRFGVKQKELLRTMRGNKHVLAMAATPIPRTLGMAISGIRDISIIATPPARRLSIRTLVRPNKDFVIREAISRELARDGQVFFLHNRIDSMDECIARLQAISPKARIRKIHGRMTEREMTEIMFAFRKHEFDLLVSTTVIEVGIDVPNANTLIIEDAVNLGLGQLHQLRGRVGRSSKQAYAYLMTNEREGAVAMRRMQAMERSSNLGEGVMIARHDMEIRGIGEILGEEQSGHIHMIGFTLYMRLLEQAIKAIDGGERRIDTAILLGNVKMPVFGKIPSGFIRDSGARLAWYQRLMSSENPKELEQNLTELLDMYGYIPNEVTVLKQSILHHMAAKKWGIDSIKSNQSNVIVEGHVSANIADLQSVLALCFQERFEVMEKSRAFVINHASIDEVAETIYKSTAF